MLPATKNNRIFFYSSFIFSMERLSISFSKIAISCITEHYGKSLNKHINNDGAEIRDQST